MIRLVNRVAIPRTEADRLSVGAAGLALIRAHEAFSPLPTLHRRGYHVIGYGTRIRGVGIDPDWLLDGPISPYRAEALLRDELRTIELYLNATPPPEVAFMQYEFDALVSLLHSIGLRAWERSTMRDHLRLADLALLIAEWRRIDDQAVGETPCACLRSRRQAEAALFAGLGIGQERA
jgi:GH24 family phage-related lysozyme (muramidase)